MAYINSLNGFGRKIFNHFVQPNWWYTLLSDGSILWISIMKNTFFISEMKLEKISVLIATLTTTYCTTYWVSFTRPSSRSWLSYCEFAFERPSVLSIRRPFTSKSSSSVSDTSLAAERVLIFERARKPSTSYFRQIQGRIASLFAFWTSSNNFTKSSKLRSAKLYYVWLSCSLFYIFAAIFLVCDRPTQTVWVDYSNFFDFKFSLSSSLHHRTSIKFSEENVNLKLNSNLSGSWMSDLNRRSRDLSPNSEKNRTFYQW